MRNVHLIISGVVQGIGYRQWFRKEMDKLEVSGWVKNRDDGSVEAIISGNEKEIETLLSHARSGPPLARVTDIHIEVLQ
jgi:acylphosphatase